MKFSIFYFILIPFFFSLLCSCHSNKILNDKSWGGRFEIEKLNHAIESAGIIYNNQPDSILPKITFEKLNGASENQLLIRKSGIHKLFPKTYPVEKTREIPDADSTPVNSAKPIEMNSYVGFWMVVGGLVSSIAVQLLLNSFFISTAVLSVSTALVIFGFFSLFAILAGAILGIIGLKVHKRNPDKYRGKGKARAAIIIPSALLFLFLVVNVLMYLFIVY